jgi:hypothetical protein
MIAIEHLDRHGDCHIGLYEHRIWYMTTRKCNLFISPVSDMLGGRKKKIVSPWSIDNFYNLEAQKIIFKSSLLPVQHCGWPLNPKPECLRDCWRLSIPGVSPLALEVWDCSGTTESSGRWPLMKSSMKLWTQGWTHVRTIADTAKIYTSMLFRSFRSLDNGGSIDYDGFEQEKFAWYFIDAQWWMSETHLCVLASPLHS